MNRNLLVDLGRSGGLALTLALLFALICGTAHAITFSDDAAAPTAQAAAGASPAAAAAPAPIFSSDDRENATPTAWWVYSGQTVSDMLATVSSNNARIVDIQLETYGTPSRFTATYVSNTGTYAKNWWFYVDVDSATLSSQLTTNNARLVSLKAYDIGGGQIRFAAVMISNTGADAKAWWWYYGQTIPDLTTQWQNNNARLVQVNSYVTAGVTRYAAVMISNTGADSRSWWWYVNATIGDVSTHLNANQARLVDLDRDPSTGNYNVIMNGCSANCPMWWWYVGSTGQQLLDNVAQTGARIFDANSFPGCGGTCYSYLMINNSNDITSRVGEMLRSGTDGTKGLYLKEVGGPVLANLEDGWVFEPASAIKSVLHVYAMHQVQTGAAHLTDNIVKYVPPVGSSCPGNTVNGTETLGTALGEMMRHSDNTRTREVSDTFGVSNIVGYAQGFGMANTHINHVIGCGGPIANQTTLQDLGTLYEKVADGTLLDATNRSTFYSLMAGKAEYQLEGYDWTGLWTTDIPNLISQETPAGTPPALPAVYQNQMDLAYKAGNYKICGATCATFVDHIAIAGWVKIPYCDAGGFNSRQYVFGTFINNSTSDTTSSATFNATKAELLREQIRAGLASCVATPPPSYNLSIANIGNGSVTSAPAGINCGATCSASYFSTAVVTLTAVPTTGNVFLGWSGGGCSGTGSCIVTMSGALAVTARFALVDEGFPGSGLPRGWKTPAGSNAPWGVGSDASYAGGVSLKAGVISNGQMSELSYTAVFAAGNVSFARKVSSEANGDYFEFLVDGVVNGSWSGEVPWSVVSYPLTRGRHTLLWRYRKNATASAGSDAAWIDSVVLPRRINLIPGLMMMLD